MIYNAGQANLLKHLVYFCAVYTFRLYAIQLKALHAPIDMPVTSGCLLITPTHRQNHRIMYFFPSCFVLEGAARSETALSGTG